MGNAYQDDYVQKIGAKIAAEFANIQDYVLSTPLVQCHWLSNEQRRVWLKLECQQLTGSFKVRGAYNALSKLSPGDQVFTASAGNHGLALATVAMDLGIAARIFVPLGASQIKVRRLMAIGADVIPAGQDVAEASLIAKRQAKQSGGHFISAFDHEDVVIGQGSLAYDIAQQTDLSFDHILLPFGGGGLFTGFGCAASALWPKAKMHGVYPDVFQRELAHASNLHAMMQKVIPTIADGLAIQHEDNSWLWPLIESLNAHFHTITEKDIKTAIYTLLNQESITCEGAGAIGLAPLLQANCTMKGDILVVLSGANITPSMLGKVLAVEIKDPYLRTLNGLRGSDLGIERNNTKRQLGTVINPPSFNKQAILEGTIPKTEAAAYSWQTVMDYLKTASAELSQIAKRHHAYVDTYHLRADHYNATFLEKLQQLLEDTIQTKDLDQHQLRKRYRLAVQLYGFARTALSWSSASTDQHGEVMFFDPSELQSGSVNYDRYGSPLLREKELKLIHVLGFDPMHQTLLMTSSGQAAYSTIESFLVRQILPSDGRVMTAPYIYFEAFEQLTELPHITVESVENWSIEGVISGVEASDSHVLFIDPVANIAHMPTFNLAEFAKRLKGRDWSHRWLVIDATMICAGLNPFSLFSRPEHPNILYYESGSKYLQLGLDLQMTGVIVCAQANGPDLARHRRNLGTGLYQGQVARFPIYERADILARMQLLTRNATALVDYLQGLDVPMQGVHVAYPKNWAQMGWCHGGGVVALTFKDDGLNNRPCLDALIEQILEYCKEADVPITQGVSFGFGTTRVSAAAAIAADTDPFLRFSMGEESIEDMQRLSTIVGQAIIDYCHSLEEIEA